MRKPAPAPGRPSSGRTDPHPGLAPARRSGGPLLQRACECGGTCDSCRDEERELRRSATGGAAPRLAPPIVHRVLARPGQPLPAEVRRSVEPDLGHDLSRVRVHADGAAAASAAAVGAHAYTVGRHVVFGAGRYSPESSRGRKLLAHELTHVAQQADAATEVPSRLPVAPSDDAAEVEAQATAERLAGSPSSAAPSARNLSAPAAVRRDNVAETTAVLALGETAGTGLQFFPTAVSGTQVGPVSGQGNLINDDQRRRLSVIVGANLSLRQMAASLLPLWETATPFTLEGETTPAPRDSLDADTLARGLLVYNRGLLRPDMSGWQAGMRFPLPVRIDRDSGEGVLHPNVITGLAGEFDAAWEPLLDQGASALAAPTADELSAAVDTFLAESVTPLGRAISLTTRALTNAAAERAFILAVFDRVGADAAELALEFMNNSVDHQIELLASQRAGAAILDRIRSLLAAAPAEVVAANQVAVDRARGLLDRVSGVVARDTPAAFSNARPPGELDVSAAGLAFIASWEGFRGELYNDAAGHCTIGYGHLVHRGNCNGTEPEEFREGISEERGLQILQDDAGTATETVQDAVDVNLTQEQFDALISFTFNVGGGAFRDSTLLRELNQGDYDEVPDQMDRWIYAEGEILQGLVRRRDAEGELFEDGVYNNNE